MEVYTRRSRKKKKMKAITSEKWESEVGDMKTGVICFSLYI